MTYIDSSRSRFSSPSHARSGSKANRTPTSVDDDTSSGTTEISRSTFARAKKTGFRDLRQRRKYDNAARFPKILADVKALNSAIRTANNSARYLQIGLEQLIGQLKRSADSAPGNLETEIASIYIALAARQSPDRPNVQALALATNFDTIAARSGNPQETVDLAAAVAERLRAYSQLLISNNPTINGQLNAINTICMLIAQGRAEATLAAIEGFAEPLMNSCRATTGFCADLYNSIDNVRSNIGGRFPAESVKALLLTLLAEHHSMDDLAPLHASSSRFAPVINFEKRLKEAVDVDDMPQTSLEERLQALFIACNAAILPRDQAEIAAAFDSIFEAAQTHRDDRTRAKLDALVQNLVKKFETAHELARMSEEEFKNLGRCDDVEDAIKRAKEKFREKDRNSADAKAVLVALDRLLFNSLSVDSYKKARVSIGRLLNEKKNDGRHWDKIATLGENLKIEEEDQHLLVPPALELHGRPPSQKAYADLKVANPFKTDKRLFIELTKLACLETRRQGFPFGDYFEALYVVCEGEPFNAGRQTPVHKFVAELKKPTKNLRERTELAEWAKSAGAYLYGEEAQGYNGSRRS